jgi:hypothetical protein
VHFIKTIFWNEEQRRLRALWRLIVQIVLLVLVGLPMQIVIGILAVAAYAAQGGGLNPEQLSDPQVLQNFLIDSPLLSGLLTVSQFAAILLSVWLAGRFIDRRRFADFGLHLHRNWWIDFGFGLFLGAFLMALIFLVEQAAGWVTVTGTFVTRNPDAAFLLALLPALLVFLMVGVYEELWSRGYQLRNMAEGLSGGLLGPRAAILVAALFSSAIFGLLHVANPNASFVSTFNIFVAGAILLAMGLLLTGELAIPIGVHISWNFFQGNVFGFPVSGTGVRGATFVAIEQGGPDLWTGGAFGPEAGLIGVAAILLGGLLTLLWVRWRYGRAGLDEDIARPPARVISDT